MEEKFNEATPLRPKGDRIIDAPMVSIDLSALTEQIRQESTWKEGDRNAITVFKTEGMRIVLVALHEHAEMKPHTAAGIISVQVLEGKIRFTTGQQSDMFEKGQMLTLHEGISHSVFAEQESIFLLTIATAAAEKQRKAN